MKTMLFSLSLLIVSCASSPAVKTYASQQLELEEITKDKKISKTESLSLISAGYDKNVNSFIYSMELKSEKKHENLRGYSFYLVKNYEITMAKKTVNDGKNPSVHVFEAMSQKLKKNTNKNHLFFSLTIPLSSPLELSSWDRADLIAVKENKYLRLKFSPVQKDLSRTSLND